MPVLTVAIHLRAIQIAISKDVVRSSLPKRGDKKMDTKIQQTSLDAYHSITSDKLGSKQLQVYLALKKIQPATNAMIANYLCQPINCITPRVHELRSKEPIPFVITSHKGTCPITHRKALFWKVNNE